VVVKKELPAIEPAVIKVLRDLDKKSDITNISLIEDVKKVKVKSVAVRTYVQKRKGTTDK
jgi:hypothetical protein